jgi:DNA-binding CsgD family transcriptional regulator/tetratricopeptide (TPR) repeat protein
MPTTRSAAKLGGVSPVRSTAATHSPRGGGGGVLTHRDTGAMASRVSSATIVGRTAELAELRAGLAEARAARPSIAFVAGESGVGKTRLLSEFQRAARADGARVLDGECVELGEGELPYAPIVAALRPLARSGDPALDALSTAARAGLAHLLPGLGTGGESPEEGSTAQARLFEGLLELFDALGRDAGLVLVIEDLHWADRSTRAFLVYLASSLCRERVLVVASYRPDELHRRHPLRPLLAELERGTNARRVELHPLTQAELKAQLADILGEPPGNDLVERLFHRSEGNPLFAEELLAAGMDGRGALPPTLRDALMLRIERLSTDAQDALRLLSVGRRLDHGMLADASHMDPRALREALREAAAAHVIVADSEGRYLFRHALLREVVADDLLPGERAELNLSLARALEGRAKGMPDHGGAYLAAGIAHHYFASGDQPKALAASVRAAEAAENVHAYGEAAALYGRVLELWDRVADAPQLTGRDHVELLRAAAWARSREHEPGRAEMLIRAALSELDPAEDPLRAAILLDRMAREQFSQGRSRDAAETRRRALELLPPEPSKARAEVLSSMSRELMLESRFRESADVAREAIAVAEAIGADGSRIRALDAMGVSLFGLARYEEGEAALRESLVHAREHGFLQTALVIHINLADALANSGRLPEARRIAEDGVALAREHGIRARWSILLRAELAFEAGDWAMAEAELPPPGRPAMGTTYINEALRWIELALGRGDHERARRLLDEADDVASDSREPQWIGPLGSLRAELERRAGDLEAARAAIDDALDRLEFCSEDVQQMARVSATGVRVEADAAVRARDLGDDPRGAIANAQMLLARVEACAATVSDPFGGLDGRSLGDRVLPCAFLASATAELARAEDRDDPELWAEAAVKWMELSRPYRGAQAERRRAEAQLAKGDREAAAATALAALEQARKIGAAWLSAEIEGFALRARLRLDREAAAEEPAAGADSDDDPFGLTPRERQVLALLADGRTNREIGQSLYMAEKTASVHVSRILSKLDVRSRTEAAALAHRVGLV